MIQTIIYLKSGAEIVVDSDSELKFNDLGQLVAIRYLNLMTDELPVKFIDADQIAAVIVRGKK